MAYENVNESIQVITFFEGGKLHPLRFKWNGRVYRINRVNNHWSVRVGNGRQVHYSVTASTPDCFEIVFDTVDFNWRLARVNLEG